MPVTSSLAAGPDFVAGTPILDTDFETRDAAIVAVVNNHKTNIDELLAIFGTLSDQSGLPNALGGAGSVLGVNDGGTVPAWNTVLHLGNGTAAAPTYSFLGDPDTGVYRSSADLLGFATGGAVRLEISNASISPYYPVLLPAGTVSAPSLSFAASPSTGLYHAGTNRIALATAGVKRVEWAAGGIVFIGDNATPANANMTVGVTINQGGNDNEIFAFKSSDVAHGMTAVTETDTFAYFKKINATDGGVLIDGLSGGTANRGFWARGIAGQGVTTKSSAALAPVYVDASIKSGTGQVSVGANGNLFVVADNGGTRFIVDVEGDLHVDGSTTLTAFDEYDDVALLSTVRALTIKNRRYAERVFGAFDREQVQLLHERGIVTITPRRGKRPDVFLSLKGLHALEIDAIRQLNRKIQRLEKLLAA